MRPLFAALLLAAPLAAQSWNDPRTLTLVDLAVARRAAQLADTGLADYRASAHGSLTFLAQMGEGFPDPPKVVRTDELAVEVYWRAPNRSKQRIVGRRDTLLLPTDIQYHRDHLAIVQNNFPSIIRLGEGDEVRDVPHPLSAAGRDAYDFAVADSLTIRTGERALDVLMVKVRPRDERLPRVVGAVYLDRASGSVVRMTFSFTRAALKDPQLEDISIILENGLVDGRFWLPRRQEIEIRRTGTWMEFPTRGIIRGRWEICCVTANAGLPASLFEGPELVAVPAAQQRRYPFHGGILESLPSDVKLAEDDDVRRVQEEARDLVRAEALARTRRTAASARTVSDLVRVNRVEGLAVGAGLTRLLGSGLRAQGLARFGTADRALKHTISLAWQRASGAGLALTARDDFRDAGDEPEVSGVRNSIAAQEFGTDLTDAYRARGASLTITPGARLGARWRLVLERERQEPLEVHARPARGAFQPAFPAEALSAWRVAVEGFRGEGPGPFGSALQADGRLLLSRVRFGQGTRPGEETAFARVALTAHLERSAGAGRLALHTSAAGVVGRDPPLQAYVFFGGPVTGPGYAYHEFAGRAGVSQRIEWRREVGAIAVPLGRFGDLPMPVSLVPFVQAIWIDRRAPDRAATGGWFPAAGLGVVTVFDLLRVDVARPLRGGRWTVAADISRAFWRIL